MDALTIRIYETLDGGYHYDIYDEDVVMDVLELTDVDGGHCTTTMLNALGMAVSQAQELIRQKLGDECDGCGVDMNKIGIGKHDYKSDDGLLLHVCALCNIRHQEEGDFIASR